MKPEKGVFALYYIDGKEDEMVLSQTMFDVDGQNVKVSCYINSDVLKVIDVDRNEARRLYSALLDEGYMPMSTAVN